MSARTRPRNVALTRSRLLDLPENLRNEIFALASSLRPLALDGVGMRSQGRDFELFHVPDVFNWNYARGHPTLYWRHGTVPAHCQAFEDQLRLLPSMRRRNSADAPAIKRIEALIVTAGTSFLRSVSPAVRDAVDAVARSTHVRLVGCPIADATTHPLSYEEGKLRTPKFREMAELRARLLADQSFLADHATEIQSVGGFDQWFQRRYLPEERAGMSMYYDRYYVWFFRTRHRDPIISFPSTVAPQKALIDRAHALLAYRGGAHIRTEWSRGLGELLEEMFYGRASTLPWAFDAWHVYVSRGDGRFDFHDEDGCHRWAEGAGYGIPLSETFDAADQRCVALAAFAAELAPVAAVGRLRGAASGPTTRVDIFGAPTRWVDRVDSEGAATRVSLLGPFRTKRPKTWDVPKPPSPETGRSEPPADVIKGFCAFSFRPGPRDVACDGPNPWHSDDDDGDDELKRNPINPKRGGFAVRAADLRVPARGSVEGPGDPIVLDTVNFLPGEGRVHLIFRFASGGERFKLVASGVVPTLQPPCPDGTEASVAADAILDSAARAAEGSIVDDMLTYNAQVNRRWGIARAAQRQREYLPRKMPSRVMPNGHNRCTLRLTFPW